MRNIIFNMEEGRREGGRREGKKRYKIERVREKGEKRLVGGGGSKEWVREKVGGKKEGGREGRKGTNKFKLTPHFLRPD